MHPDLTDWSLMERWKGNAWNQVPSAFPGELEAYLDHPSRLEFIDEQLGDVASRIAGVARALDAQHPHGDVIIVSHQDAIQAGRLALIGSDLSALHEDPPGDGSVVSLRPGPAWKEETAWSPGDTPRFGERSDLRVVTSAGQPDRPSPA